MSRRVSAAVQPAPSRVDRVSAFVEKIKTRKYGEMDPCGECPKGTCDHCEMCDYFADPPWAEWEAPV